MKTMEEDEVFSDAAFLLLDQALLVEGEQLKDPADFVDRLNRVMQRAL
jgi:molecular chaperone HtpG